MPTVTYGTLNTSNGSFSTLIQSNFSMPTSGALAVHASPNGKYYYKVTSVSCHVRRPQSPSLSTIPAATAIRFTIGSNPGGRNKLDLNMDANTTLTYTIISKDIPEASQPWLVSGESYFAGPAGTGNSIQSTRTTNSTGFSLYHNGVIPSPTALTNPTSSQTYFTLTYYGVPTAPGEPTSSNPTSTTVDLAWTAPGSNGGSAITGYLVQRATNSSFTAEVSTVDTQSTARTITLTGLDSTKTYYFRVAAYNRLYSGTNNNSNATSLWSGSSGSVDPTPEAGSPEWSTEAQLPNGTVNVSYSTTVSATSDDPNGITYSKISGASWISVSTGGIVFGTPTTAGLYPVVIAAANSNPTATQRTFFITIVEQAPFWVPANQSLNSLVVINKDYISNFNASNVIADNPYSYSGTLPAGVTFDTQTGDFSGKPTEAGTFNNIYVRARGKDGTTLTKGPYTLNVIYPGQRQTENGTFSSFIQGQRFAPGEEGASFTGWKKLSFMKRWNGEAWEDLS